MYICLILNILIIIAMAAEMNADYAVILDESIKLRDKRKYIIRLVAILLLAFVALMIVYNRFGITDYNLEYYMSHGTIG